MTDGQGRYSIDAPAGAHEINASMMGYIKESEHVRIGNGDTVTVDFDLDLDPNSEGTETIHPYPPRSIPFDIYPVSTTPIRWESLEFELRYVLTRQGDSVIVNVVAEGRNVTAEPFTSCGHFAFWSVTFLPSQEVFDEITRLGGRTPYEGPILDVSSDKFVPGPLVCEPVQVQPGESIARGMTFSFEPKAFEYWTGEVGIQCYFFTGNDGDEWRDVKRIGLGSLKVPIRPIGQPRRKP